MNNFKRLTMCALNTIICDIFNVAQILSACSICKWVECGAGPSSWGSDDRGCNGGEAEEVGCRGYKLHLECDCVVRAKLLCCREINCCKDLTWPSDDDVLYTPWSFSVCGSPLHIKPSIPGCILRAILELVEPVGRGAPAPASMTGVRLRKSALVLLLVPISIFKNHFEHRNHSMP